MNIWSLLLILSLQLPVAHAALITYRDDKGTLHVVSSENEIPEQYRNKKKKIADISKRTLIPGQAPVYKQGNAYLVDVDFGKGGVHRMEIDLKHPFTTISPAITSALKLEPVDRATIPTTSGVVARFPMVIVPKMVIGGRAVENLKLISAPDGVEGSSGKLGQNFFASFDVKIDQERNELFLTPKSKK